MILRFSNIRGQLGVSPQPFLASRECHGSLGTDPGAVLERFDTAVCSDKSVKNYHIHGSLNVPMFHITQPLGINGL